MNKRHLVVVGATAGLGNILGLQFDPNEQYTGCRICGEVFQTNEDRRHCTDPIEELELRAICQERRRLWSFNHAATHTEKEHADLAASGNWCTPEAAKKLASYGVISLVDIVMSPEHEQAYAESKAIPDADASY